MLLRANFALFLISLFCAWCLFSFASSAIFSEPVDMAISIIDNRTREIRFPSLLSVRKSPVIIVPATTESVGGDRFLISEATFVTFFEGNYYWVSEDLVITDFVSVLELKDVPVVSGISFVLRGGEFRLLNNEQTVLLGHVKRLLSDGKIWSIVAHVDLVDGYLLLKRGIRITVYDWEKLSKSVDALHSLFLSAADKSEYLFLGEGNLLRVR